MHFSRNPKIAQYMRAYKLVKEFGEGVDRMFREMQEAGSPEPVFEQLGFMVKASIYQHKSLEKVQKQEIYKDEKEVDVRDNVRNNVLEEKFEKLSERQQLVMRQMQLTATRNVLDNVLENVVETQETLADRFRVSERTIRRDLKTLQEEGFLRHEGPDHGGCYMILYF